MGSMSERWACCPISSVVKWMATSFLDGFQNLPVSNCNTLLIDLPLIRSLDLKISIGRNIPIAFAFNCISPKHGSWRRCWRLLWLLYRKETVTSWPTWLSIVQVVFSRSKLVETSIIFRCLQVISPYPRCTPTSHLHFTLNVEAICLIILWLTAKFFAYCPSHPNPIAQ